jgi:hypothetical protein
MRRAKEGQGPDLIQAAAQGFTQSESYPDRSSGPCLSYAFVAIGFGQFYLFNIKDKDGDNFDGGKIPHLHCAAERAANEYWSLTTYDRENHALIKNVDRASAPRTAQK